MASQNDILDIFSILHDGTIDSWAGDRDKLTLRVSCYYLAELIDKSFQYFYVELLEITEIELYAWMNPVEQEQEIFKDLKQIFQAELEINSAEKKEKNVLVSCIQSDTDFNYCGGNLTLNCNSINVYDHNKKQLTIDKFDKICNQYWDNFEKE